MIEKIYTKFMGMWGERTAPPIIELAKAALEVCEEAGMQPPALPGLVWRGVEAFPVYDWDPEE